MSPQPYTPVLTMNKFREVRRSRWRLYQLSTKDFASNSPILDP
jgi:uncharacterized protein YjiS (DUF1127 family)